MDAVKAFLNEIATRAIAAFKAAALITKLVWLGVLLVLLFLAARVGILGDAPQALAGRVYPAYIPVVDPLPRVVGVDFAVATVRDGAPAEILRDAPCYSGETLRIGVTPAEQAWIILFGMDAHSGAYPISDTNYSAKLVGAGQELSQNVQLDAAEGTEIFFALTAPVAFTVEPAQLETAHTALFPPGGKGGQVEDLNLDFGDGVAISSYRCRHLQN